MINKKKISYVLIVFFVFLVPWLVYIGNIRLVGFDINFYEKEFEKYETVDNSVEITSDLISFFKMSENNEDLVKSFEKDEISHLIDVKRILYRFFFVYFLFIVLALLILFGLVFSSHNKFIKYLGTSLSLGGIFTLFLSGVFYLLTLNFDWFFVRFHELFFTGNWTFPGTSLLIKLFPQVFWIDITKKIMFNVFISANILILLGIILLLMSKYLRWDK